MKKAISFFKSWEFFLIWCRERQTSEFGEIQFPVIQRKSERITECKLNGFAHVRMTHLGDY